MKSLRELAKEAHECAVRHGLWKLYPAVPTRLMLIVTECSEAMEAYRKKQGQEFVVALGEELADIIIFAADLAERYGIDIEAQIDRKMAINWRRPYQHGDKRREAT